MQPGDFDYHVPPLQRDAFEIQAQKGCFDTGNMRKYEILLKAVSLSSTLV